MLSLACSRDWGAVTTEQVDDRLFFLAASPAMLRLRAEIEQVARVDVPVLCVGESGTGKEVVAHLLHKRSPRAERTFLKVNCAALPAELLESELFGYEAGAFTGAVRSKAGKFELCDRGTVFLDEIVEMPTSLQAKLLHVLQDQEYARLGGRSRVKVNIRVIAATNVDIDRALAAKRLRPDLLYRLNTFVFRLPPLRERREDIALLFRHYVQHFAERFEIHAPAVPGGLLECAMNYQWPGNVRELENFAKRFVIFGDEEQLLKELNGNGRKNGGCAHDGDLKAILDETRKDVEPAVIRRALEEACWNRKQAARLLHISYATLLSKIRRYGLDKEAGDRG